ncbi:MAG: peptidoglycan-binding protein [Verrucomicrobia bacterium]|nr:peptidoglycan-binding protein [Verrucomicrobiota bacterium]
MAKLQLAVGSFGEEIKKLHCKLIEHGLAIPSSEVDRAFFGPATRYAVLEWQRSHGLAATGIVDERTDAMLEVLAQSRSVQPQSPASEAPSLITSPGATAKHIFAPDIGQTFAQARVAASKRAMREVNVNGTVVPVRYPFPSPIDWRDCWMYFLLLDRFANHQAPPNWPWNQQFDYRQGGTFKGVTTQLNYLQGLGVKALWLSPVLKNPRPNWKYNYHGYDTQDFLHIDERFGSDGTLASAERELAELIAQAHGRGIFVVLDMVLNHAARVFDYVYQGQVVDKFDDWDVMNAPLGQEPPIQWLNGYGFPRADWQDQIPPDTRLSPDDAVYPDDFQEKTFFRRRGNTLSYALSPEGFVKGDFIQQRQLVVEYDATASGDSAIRAKYGPRPVLNILIHAYQYLIAKFDFDGFRIDTAKHISPPAIETFGNAIREFAQTLGKRNFLTFGEIYDNEETINRFVGRHSPNKTGFGIDAALDYPLFFKVTDIVKGLRDVAELPVVFERRKQVEDTLISSHGEAGQYFVTFLDNHDQSQRFKQPSTPPEQVTMGLAVLFCLQGIPAIYYGTEQGLQGTVDKNDLHPEQSVREALWGKPNAFDKQSLFYTHIKALSRLREEQPALRFGRLYFRQVTANGRDFGYSSGTGGLVAFSRLVSDVEVLVVANTSMQTPFDGLVLQDPDLNSRPRRMLVSYSNLGVTGATTVRQIFDARFFSGEQLTGTGDVSALPVGLAPMEVKVWVPEQPLSF